MTKREAVLTAISHNRIGQVEIEDEILQLMDKVVGLQKKMHQLRSREVEMETGLSRGDYDE